MMMQSHLRSKPIYLLLLSFFFIFHGYIENYDLIPVKELAPLLLLYLASSVLLDGIIWLFIRNVSKASFLAFLLMGFYFFFGAIYDRIRETAPGSFFTKYSVLLLCFSIIFTGSLFYLIKRKTPLSKLNHILNIFFLLLLFVDCLFLGYKVINQKSFTNTPFQKEITVCDTCSKPDIYLILVDEYVGYQSLKETMNFDNSPFINELRSRGFYSPSTLSNYNFTAFSMASMFDMDYLQGLEGKNTSHKDLSICYKLIRKNKAFQFLSAQGYKLYNYSVFDIYDQPSFVKGTILPERTRFITAQTLFNRVDNNILFNMADKFGAGTQKRRLMLDFKSNAKSLDSLKSIIRQRSLQPRFIYTHLMMPHHPYYFDKDGNFRDYESIGSLQVRNISHYLEYLQYTNKVLLEVIDNIFLNSEKPPVIILASDHGFREYPTPTDLKYSFMNFLAINLPQKDYRSYYDGITNVNLFRLLFNQQFQQNFPLLKDSTSFLRP